MPHEKTTPTLSERIAAKALAEGTQKDINRATFLALRDDIKHALAEGWAAKKIWRDLYKQGIISFSYQSFMGYVNRLILGKTKDTKSIKTKDIAIQKTQVPKTCQKQEPENKVIREFKYNPNIPLDELI